MRAACLSDWRGDWVDAAGVPAGEVVEIIRGTVSDDAEGDFVEARRPI